MFHVAIDLGAGSGRAMLGRVDGDGVVARGGPPFPLRAGRLGGRLRWPFESILDGHQAGAAARAGAVVARAGRSVRAWASTRGASTTGSSTRAAGCSRTRSATATTAPTARSSACCARCRAARSSSAPASSSSSSTRCSSCTSTCARACRAARGGCCCPRPVPPRAVRLDRRRVHERLDDTAPRRAHAALGRRPLLAPVALPRELMPEPCRRARLSASCGRRCRRSWASGRSGARAGHARHRPRPSPAVPLEPGWAYVSSGTWSLVGVELAAPLVNDDVARANFTNEGGVGGTVRFLKNVMGLWIFDSCRHEWEARGASARPRVAAGRRRRDRAPPGLVFPDHPRFFNPRSMTARGAGALSPRRARTCPTTRCASPASCSTRSRCATRRS